MLEWLQSIGDFISTMIDFLVAFFKNVVEIVLLVFRAVVILTEVVALMPPPYMTALYVLVAFSVIVTVIHFGG